MFEKSGFPIESFGDDTFQHMNGPDQVVFLREAVVDFDVIR